LLSKHETSEDYSSWLIPAVSAILDQSSIAFGDVDLLAVATGPGSFTGIRVGLTAVKAWAEVYRTPVVGVSRLEAMASCAMNGEKLVAAFYDAHRGQIFAGLYRQHDDSLELIEVEAVQAPQEFLNWVSLKAAGLSVRWVSLDPELVSNLDGWKARESLGDSMDLSSCALATAIGELGKKRAERRQFTDPLQLDANYVRRSDAEILWKGWTTYGR
jgi:tRNA threonylcarbamoyladenosine biosynthesis protein TsaB